MLIETACRACAVKLRMRDVMIERFALSMALWPARRAAAAKTKALNVIVVTFVCRRATQRPTIQI